MALGRTGLVPLSLVLLAITLDHDVTAGYCSSSPGVRHSAEQPPVLRVGREVRRQKQEYGPSCEYTVLGLRESSCYEVKVSYPGTMGARFILQLKQRVGTQAGVEGGEGGGGLVERGKGSLRRLLDTEKVVFCTSPHGLVQSGGDAFPMHQTSVSVAVERTGVLPMGLTWEQMEDGGALFNIVCEELLLGIPQSSFPLMATCILLALFSAAVGYHFRMIVLFLVPRKQKD